MSIRLDKRLSAVASFVRQGKTLLDIGTDHAYLPVYCVKSGICPSAVISDINRGPLENAEKTVAENGLEGRITAVLSDGFESLKQSCAEEIVIAGMGGTLMAEILSKAQWIKSKRVHLILQPMTHAEDARQFLCSNGFFIDEEKAIGDGSHLYCVISAYYDGNKQEKPGAYYYYGEMIKNIDGLSSAFLEKTLNALKKKRDALFSSGREPEKQAELNEIISDFETEIEKRKGKDDNG